ncbi:type I secretion system permease/ATPase [Marinobacter daepoensis]|uniref:type I secretion system permease/ATPase n=1 Tax=Marinobacter daepoensis TaxID=262077 RepID=UPI001C97B3AE|nr:type I secretion system permease/ATPase [Marinobacter daepoensis]MBY6031667.1 type I secretion system permease/ATPase [Marinobacter daepoensis]
MLLECLRVLCRFHNRPLNPAAAMDGLPLNQGKLTPSVFPRAAKRAGMSSRIARVALQSLNPHLLPAILLLKDDRACIITSLDANGETANVIWPELPDSEQTLGLDELAELYTGYVIYARPEFRFDQRTPEVKTRRPGHWFWSIIKENRRLYRDVAVAALAINVFALAMPLFVMNVYDRVVPNHAVETLWVLAAGVLIVLCADLVLRLMRSWFVDLAASRADIQLSARIMEHLLSLGLKDRPTSVGSFANNVQSFEAVRSFMGSLTVVALVDLPFVLLFTGIITLIAWPLVLPILAGGLLLVLYALAIQHKLHSLSERSMQAGSMRNAILVESLSNLETVKSFGSESRIQLVWEKTTIFLTRTAAQTRLLASSISSGAGWVQHTVGVLIILIGVYQVIAGDLSQGGLIAAYMLSSRAMAPISQAASLLGQYHSAATAMTSLNDIMALPGERPDDAPCITHPPLRGDIEFRGVSFSYPGSDQQSLRDVSFRIRAGERVAILGRNGSGKSTLEKLMLGLFAPQAGTVSIDGVDIGQYDPAELRRQIGYVPQDIHLFFGSLKENIVLGNPQASDAQIIEAARIAALEPLVSQHPEGFNLPVGEGGQQLSGGQRQAVAVARGVLGERAMLLLDEPTGSLDQNSEAIIKGNLTRYSQDKTLILVTHRSALLDLVDRIIVMDQGKVVADGEKSAVVQALQKGHIGAAR